MSNDNMTPVFRIGLREEPDGFIRAYLAPVDSFNGATCFASIRADVLLMDGAIEDAFKQVMRLTAGALSIEAFGVAPSAIREAKRKAGDK